jgi:putative DNA methylase
MSDDQRRLIEVAFPLKQASLDSVHEKNVRHGHISTLHIWPARRPLATCRAALIATLLPDPGTPEKRKQLLEKIGGKIVTEVQKKKVGGKTVETIKERTEGGVLRWGNENSPDMDLFREEIKKAYGGRAPRVLDPFAGGGAIPPEAMRLGCETTAIDINPVAWLILKCTLEHPQKLAGQTLPLPKFALESGEFMEAFLKGTGKLSKKQAEKEIAKYQRGLFPPPDADLAWHVRAWGWWVLQKAREDLEPFYPTIDGKPTVAYLWARTVTCKNCRATIPLHKTRWLCKKDNNRVVLTMIPNADRTGVEYGIQVDLPKTGGNEKQQREFDRLAGLGTMTGSGVRCPICLSIIRPEDLRLEGVNGALGLSLTAVVVDGGNDRDYRLPTKAEIDADHDAALQSKSIFACLPHGEIDEPIDPASTRSISCNLYGIDDFSKAFTDRQRHAIASVVRATRAVIDVGELEAYPIEWKGAIYDYLCLGIDRLVDRTTVFCRPDPSPTQSGVINTYSEFALSIKWDFIEAVPIGDASGGYLGGLEWAAKAIEHCLEATSRSQTVLVRQASATDYECDAKLDLILTDPPYYKSISYADLSDLFYVWQKRLQEEPEFQAQLTPKDKEVVQHVRQDKDPKVEKARYENGMYEAIYRSFRSLNDSGRLVIVFAHKEPDAWETLVSAMIRAGFCVTASWPIQTERAVRKRAIANASLSSSVWLVCKKRPDSARPGWDNRVLDEMRHNIHTRLRDYWDAGIRGPDFVWAATGPAMEAYSKHPVVKKANEPGKLMEVSEFLRAVRRLVVDFVVGRVLTGEGGDETTASGLDDVTTYYILHRHDFGLGDAPVGACILYAVSCNLSDTDLTNRHEILLRTGGLAAAAAEDDGEADDEIEEPDADAEPEEGSGTTVKLRPWNQRKRKTMGYDEEGRPAPLIDQVHRLMLLWKLGDVVKVDDYLDARGLRKNGLFLQLLQALIELADEGTDERVVLENLSNHLAARGVAPVRSQTLPGLGGDLDEE